MNRLQAPSSLAAGLAASALLATAAPAQAAITEQDVAVAAGASCSANHDSSALFWGVTADQCKVPDAQGGAVPAQEGKAEASFTKLKTFAATGPGNPNGASVTAGALVLDGATVTPTDTSLLGTRGVYAIKLHVDGTLSPGAGVFVGGYSMIDWGLYIEQRQVSSFQQGLSSDWGWLGVGWAYAGAKPISANGDITMLLPMVFGERFYYELGMTSSARGPSQASSFFSTAMITAVDAFTNDNPYGDGVMITSNGTTYGVYGRQVGFAVTTASGIDIVAEAAINAASLAPVPEPETWAMLLAGLGVVGGLARRRRAA